MVKACSHAFDSWHSHSHKPCCPRLSVLALQHTACMCMDVYTYIYSCTNSCMFLLLIFTHVHTVPKLFFEFGAARQRASGVYLYLIHKLPCSIPVLFFSRTQCTKLMVVHKNMYACDYVIFKYAHIHAYNVHEKHTRHIYDNIYDTHISAQIRVFRHAYVMYLYVCMHAYIYTCARAYMCLLVQM